MEIINVEGFEFIRLSFYGAEVYFSTAKNNLNFNMKSEEFAMNIEKLKQWFKLSDLGYVKQIHSNLIYDFNGTILEGDGLTTDKKNTAVGVFTADCIPVLFYDKRNKVCAAIHSGWKGTELQICSNAVKKMINDYGSDPKDIMVAIGPHNRSCCYEFGKEEAEKSFKEYFDQGLKVYESGKLNLEICIEQQLKASGIKESNITSVPVCTFCSEKFDLYSFRKKDKYDGRMFSFIVCR